VASAEPIHIDQGVVRRRAQDRLADQRFVEMMAGRLDAAAVARALAVRVRSGGD
jgi:hypothetical protein